METQTPWQPLITPVSLPDGHTVRELGPDEWHRIVLDDGRILRDLTQEGNSVHVVILEDPEGRLLAQCPIFAVAHADGLWSDGSLAQHPRAVTAFLGAVVTLLQRAEVRSMYACAHPGGESAAILDRLGFQLVPERLFHATIPEGAK